MDIAEPLESLAADLGLPAPEGRMAVSPTDDIYGSPYAVTAAAGASVGAAVWAVSVLDAMRRGGDPDGAELDGRHAAVLFHSERLVRITEGGGGQHWGEVSGNYRTADGWLRIHANLARHRKAALSVLEATDREELATAVERWSGEELEAAILDAGGVASILRTRDQWRNHPQRTRVDELALVDRRDVGDHAPLRRGRWLEGVRVLDLTRVISGPVAGRFLASFGAQVLRVDPPLDDGLLLEIDTSQGKRRTALDLSKSDERRHFDELVANADVLLHAFRPGTLPRLGYDEARLLELRPHLISAQLTAYGDRGPWGARRGFDSVVQVATGVAHHCGFDPRTGPSALPAQALDHASGYLLASGIIAALTSRASGGPGAHVRVALARTAQWLETLPASGRGAVARLADEVARPYLDVVGGTAWGELTHVRPAGRVGARAAAWDRVSPPRGHHEPVW